jgi:hypothetical protein
MTGIWYPPTTYEPAVARPESLLSRLQAMVSQWMDCAAHLKVNAERGRVG